VIRETFLSALELGRRTLLALGRSDGEAEEIREDVRRRDLKRLEMQFDTADIKSGGHLTHKQAVRESVRPTPLDEPTRASRGLTPETQQVLDHAARELAATEQASSATEKAD
jgi:hypothetical protein